MERLPPAETGNGAGDGGPLLNAEQRKIFVGQDTMRLGMSYGHLMSVCVAPEESPVPLHLGNTAGMASWEPCSPTTLQPAAAC